MVSENGVDRIGTARSERSERIDAALDELEEIQHSLCEVKRTTSYPMSSDIERTINYLTKIESILLDLEVFYKGHHVS